LIKGFLFKLHNNQFFLIFNQLKPKLNIYYFSINLLLFEGD
jgi:hypothetical protein